MANLVKSIYTGNSVTAIGELTSSDTVNFPGATTIEGALTIGSNGTVLTYNSSNDNLEFSKEVSLTDAIMSGTLRGPASFTIDPATDGASGTVIIAGNLQVDGTTTTINSTQLTVEDKIITLASGATNSTQANDSGFEIAGANASFKYFETDDKFVSNKEIYVNTAPLASTGKAIAMSMVFG